MEKKKGFSRTRRLFKSFVRGESTSSLFQVVGRNQCHVDAGLFFC